MTPVLPEVPAPNKRAFYFCNKCGHMGSEGPKHPKHGTTDEDCGYLAVTDGDSYTTAQLRAYATDYSAPFVDELRRLYRAYVSLLESGRDRITDLGGSCDPVDVMERNDPYLIQARRTLALLTQPEQNSGR